jgi:hypothetical protein
MLPGFINIYHSSLISIQEISIDHDLLFRELMEKMLLFFLLQSAFQSFNKKLQVVKRKSEDLFLFPAA